MPVEKEEFRFSLLSELSCRGCRPQLHILVLSRNPFSRFGCHPHIKSPTSGPHWAIMGIVVFLGWFWAFWDPESAGCHFLLCRHFCGQSHMLEQRRADRDCGPWGGKPRRSPLLPVHLQLRTAVAATTLAASQMHLSSLRNTVYRNREILLTISEKYISPAPAASSHRCHHISSFTNAPHLISFNLA